ncbi:YciI family protein [Nocardia sp. CDC160]|uniref:YciI family protein n=1 Tax=Nocardia sp. CDC160 TaxID=3112166 RepID=UPI002DB74FBD|nr:YciI family protein [Nocardia sp. CDC160]MEC3918922.1 YciI family protein [Nocardia sp. CDC160]
MAKFLIVFRSHKDTFDTMSPEQIRMFNQKWQEWWAQGAREGWMLDASKALKTEGRVINADNTVTDGPLVEGTDVVRGYLNVQADTLDAAAELAKACPVLQHGGRVEVRPFFETHPGV